MTDWELLQAWTEQRSETAFEELVRRHLNLVYGSAMRQLGDADLAHDVCQAVFLTLAQKARRLSSRVILSGWLYRTTCHVAARVRRTDYRRQRRELEAATMNATSPDSPPEHWPEVAPHLDAALASLGPADRDAVVLRFLERQTFRAVAERFGITEEAAKKRVQRAVEKLRNALVRRGVAVNAAALAALLLQMPAEAAPNALSRAVAAASVKSAVPAWVAGLAQSAGRDLVIDQVKSFLPLAAAALVIVSAGLWWSLSGPTRPAATPQVASALADAASSSSGRLAAVNHVSGQRGPCRLELTVVSAESSQPLVADIRARGSGFRTGEYRRDLFTDARGFAGLPVDGARVDNLTVWVSAPGHVPVVLRWTGHEFVEPVLQHTVRLNRGHTLQGTVIDELGAPVSGAAVTFNGPGIDVGSRENVGFHALSTSIKTDEAGHFRSDQMPLPVGDHSLTYDVEHPDFVRGSGGIANGRSLETNHVVVLERGHMIRGVVTTADGVAIPDARVVESHHFAGIRRRAVANASGEFELGPFAAGEMRIEAAAEGFKEANLRIEVTDGMSNLVVKLAPAQAGERSDWEQGMENGATIRLQGQVIDEATGAPVSRFRVRLDEHRGTDKRLLGEGRNGRFDWPVFMAFFSEYSLDIDADGFAPASTDSRPVTAGTAAFEIRLQRAGYITGQIVTSAGMPAANAFVGLNGDGFGCMLVDGHRPTSGNNAPQTVTDAEGRFSFPPSEGAESILAVSDAGCALVSIRDLARGPVTLQPWGSIEGVLTVAGAPAPNQSVALTSAVGFEPEGALIINVQANATTDADGRFQFTQVPPGSVTVCRFFNFNRDKIGPVGMSHHQKVTVPAGGVAQVALGGQGRTLVGKLALSRDLKRHDWRDDLQSLVEAGQSAPPPVGQPNSAEWRRSHRNLQRFWAAQRKFYLELQPDGRFRIPDVQPGDYTLEIAVCEPPNPDVYDPLGNPVHRRTLAQLSRAVHVDGATDPGPAAVQDLGTITVELH